MSDAKRLKRLTSGLAAALAGLTVHAQAAPNGGHTRAAEMAQEKAALLAALQTADGAQFRDVTLTRSSGASIYCGSVNAKDRSGRYLGFEPFIVFNQEVKIYSEDQSFENFKELWSMTCNAGHKVPVPEF